MMSFPVTSQMELESPPTPAPAPAANTQEARCWAVLGEEASGFPSQPEPTASLLPTGTPKGQHMPELLLGHRNTLAPWAPEPATRWSLQLLALPVLLQMPGLEGWEEEDCGQLLLERADVQRCWDILSREEVQAGVACPVPLGTVSPCHLSLRLLDLRTWSLCGMGNLPQN